MSSAYPIPRPLSCPCLFCQIPPGALLRHSTSFCTFLWSGMGLDIACATDIDEQSYRKSHKMHCKLLSILSMAFTTSRTKQATKLIDDIDEQSVLYPHASLHPSCIFCGASKENGFNVVWEVSQMLSSVRSCMLTPALCRTMYIQYSQISILLPNTICK